MENIRLKIKEFIKKFFSIAGTTHAVSAGAALGIFLGIFPGGGLLIALFLAYIFRLNRSATIIGVLASTPWTFPILPAAGIIGGFMFNENPRSLIEQFSANHHLGLKFILNKTILLDVALPLVVGFLFISGIIAVLSYFILFYFITEHKIKLSRKAPNNSDGQKK